MRVAIIDASLRSLSVESARIRLIRNHADALLSRMAEDGEIERVRRGPYGLLSLN
jgi:predicted transcriptional regulator of viral defense system